MKGRVLLMVAAVALAGCTGDDVPGEDVNADDSSGIDVTDDAEETVLPPAPTEWLMAADETLHNGEPEYETSEEFPVQSFHRAFIEEFDLYIGNSNAYEQDLLVKDVEFEITIRHDGPSVNTGPALGINGAFGVGINAEGSNGMITFYGDRVYRTPESTEAFTTKVAVQPGGLVVPRGAALSLGTASFYVNPDDIEGSVFLMNSAEHPSGLTATTEWITLPAVQDPENLLSESGTFPERSPDQAGCGDNAQEGVAKFSHTVTIPEDAGEVFIEAVGASNADVDIYVQAGGEEAAAMYPASPELLRLHSPNIDALGTGDWTVEVHNCAEGPLDYDLTVDVHRLVPALESEVVEPIAE